MNIGKAIKEIRKERGLSQTELAKASGTNRGAIWALENGKRNTFNGTLEKICQALNEPLIYVLWKSLDEKDFPDKKERYKVVKGLVDGLFE